MIGVVAFFGEDVIDTAVEVAHVGISGKDGRSVGGNYDDYGKCREKLRILGGVSGTAAGR